MHRTAPCCAQDRDAADGRGRRGSGGETESVIGRLLVSAARG